MTTPTKTPEGFPADTTSKRWTVNDLLAEIPEEWRGARIAVGDNLNRAFDVRRVSLVKNRNGSRVIIIHAKEFDSENRESL